MNPRKEESDEEDYLNPPPNQRPRIETEIDLEMPSPQIEIIDGNKVDIDRLENETCEEMYRRLLVGLGIASPPGGTLTSINMQVGTKRLVGVALMVSSNDGNQYCKEEFCN